MTPLNCQFDSDTGILRTDEQVLTSPGLARADFDRGLGQHIRPRQPAQDIFLYDLDSIQLWGQGFVGGIRFVSDVVDVVILTLEQGRVRALGYDATEKDLLKEKKTLTTILSKRLARPLSSTSLGADVFELPWGGVVARADLKSTWCGVVIHYQ